MKYETVELLVSMGFKLSGYDIYTSGSCFDLVIPVIYGNIKHILIRCYQYKPLHKFSVYYVGYNGFEFEVEVGEDYTLEEMVKAYKETFEITAA